MAQDHAALESSLAVVLEMIDQETLDTGVVSTDRREETVEKDFSQDSTTNTPEDFADLLALDDPDDTRSFVAKISGKDSPDVSAQAAIDQPSVSPSALVALAMSQASWIPFELQSTSAPGTILKMSP